MIRDILKAQTMIDNIHESCFKSYWILEFAKEMLTKNTPPGIVLLIIDELEKSDEEVTWDIVAENLKDINDCTAQMNRLEIFMKKSDIGFCDCCGWFHEIGRGDHFNQCQIEGMDDKWVCDVCLEIPEAHQRELIEQRKKLLGE